MSLINEALKRAKQAQKENPVPPPALQFKAADPTQQHTSGPPVLLIVAIVVALALVGVLVVIAFQKQGATPIVNARQPNEMPSQSAPLSAGTPVASLGSVPGSVVQSKAVPAPTLAAGSAQPSPTTNSFATTVNPTEPSPVETDSATNGAVAVVDPAPSQPRSPKLQGIFYRPGRPSAVINGKNVYIGSRVAEFQVLAITQETVTIGSATQTNVLSLAE